MHKKNFLIFIGGGLIFMMIALALLAPLLATHDPMAIELPKRYGLPNSEHFFGLDQNGSDIYSKTLYGAQVSLLVALTVTSISLVIGLIVGSVSGFMGGKVDMLIMRFLDMLYAFPAFLLALALVAVFGPSLQNLILAMCITGWTGYARLVRGEVLHLKQREYVVGAVAIGASPMRQVIMHIWPNLVGPLVVQATFGMAGTIIAESSLSFLGLGAPPDTPTWGALLNSGRQVLIEAPHISIFPGIFILLLVLGFNLFGDGLRDRFDPKKAH